jgi:hypothetical protein
MRFIQVAALAASLFLVCLTAHAEDAGTNAACDAMAQQMQYLDNYGQMHRAARIQAAEVLAGMPTTGRCGVARRIAKVELVKMLTYTDSHGDFAPSVRADAARLLPAFGE